MEPNPKTELEHYRNRAREMVQLAARTSDVESRISYLLLAASWAQLAEQVEHPTW